MGVWLLVGGLGPRKSHANESQRRCEESIAYPVQAAQLSSHSQLQLERSWLWVVKKLTGNGAESIHTGNHVPVIAEVVWVALCPGTPDQKTSDGSNGSRDIDRGMGPRSVLVCQNLAFSIKRVSLVFSSLYYTIAYYVCQGTY